MKKRNKKTLLIAIIVITLFHIITTSSYNYEYVNTTTKVNITKAYPEILAINIDQNILLSAGTTKIVNCNITIRDWNGWDDINITNATFWDNNVTTMAAADNNNNHYTNSSCTEYANDGGYIANYTCKFSVWYYANPSINWTCNATVMDNNNFTDSGQNYTNIQLYYALNVTSIIDYGDMASASFSSNITANISNFGNAKINISVRGYGGFDPVIGDGYAMICEQGNITIANQRFSSSPADNWAAKTILSSVSQNISGISLQKQTGNPIWNLTYWQLYTSPVNLPFGECNGTVEFTAEIGG